MATIRLEHLWKLYGQVEAVRDLNLTCRDGELLALLGPSGCGKTSTLKMIAGIEDITGGEIYFDDRPVGGLGPGERNIAMVFEDYALYPRIKVYDNIAFPLRIRKRPGREIEERVQGVAAMLHLDDILHKRVEELSGGQQQRVAIGRALVRSPELLLLDEPLSHLDAQLKVQLRAEMKRLQKETGVTSILVTHDQLEAMAMADRIAIMNLGVLQQVGSPEELYDHPANLFVAGFVGEPPMNFVEGTLSQEDGSYWLDGAGMRIPVPGERAGWGIRSARGRGVIMGIRPEDVQISRRPEGDFLPAEVFFREGRGDEEVVILKIKDQLLYAETGSHFRASQDEMVWVSFNMDKAHLFDPESGLALAASEAV